MAPTIQKAIDQWDRLEEMDVSICNNEIITALTSTSHGMTLVQPSSVGFSYLLGPCSIFFWIRKSSTKLLALSCLWQSSFTPLALPTTLISPRSVSNPGYSPPVPQVPQTLYIQSQTHYFTLQTYFSFSNVLFHERYLIHPETCLLFLPPLQPNNFQGPNPPILSHDYCHCPSSGLIIF